MVMSYKKARRAGLDYYLDSGEDAEPNIRHPHWYASPDLAGARAALGVVDDLRWGTSDLTTFRSLGEGRHPHTGEDLVRNCSSPARVAIHDFTFSAPKSVSVAWALADEAMAGNIVLAQHAATRAALDIMAHHGACSRQGRAGIIKAPVGLLGALFHHGSSRANDPQLHTHAVIFNVAQRADGSTGAIEASEMLHWQGVAGCLYAAELAWQMSAMGFTLEPSGRLFELADVPRHVRHAFSTRGQDVVRAVHAAQARRGHVANVRAASLAERQRAAWATRPPKCHAPLDDLRRIWRKRAAEMAFYFDRMTRDARMLARDNEVFQRRQSQQLELASAAVAQLLDKSPHVQMTQLYVEIVSALNGQASAAQVIEIALELVAALPEGTYLVKGIHSNVVDAQLFRLRANSAATSCAPRVVN